MARSSSLRRPFASQTASAATTSASEPHPVGDGAQHLRGRLCRLELALVHDRDLPRGLGEPLGDLADHRHLVSDLDHERTQVEDDRASFCLDEGRVVVEQANELALRPGRDLHPHRLHARALERCIGCIVGARARDTRQDRSEPLQVGGQALGDRRLHVDVREQRVHRLRRDLRADLVVFDHLPRDRSRSPARRGRCARRRRRPSRRAPAGSRRSSGCGRLRCASGRSDLGAGVGQVSASYETSGAPALLSPTVASTAVAASRRAVPLPRAPAADGRGAADRVSYGCTQARNPRPRSRGRLTRRRRSFIHTGQCVPPRTHVSPWG